MKTISLAAILPFIPFCSLQASMILYSDLGTGSNVYNFVASYTVAGSASVVGPNSKASPFTVSGSGDFDVSQIDLGVTHSSGSTAFTASIWTDASGQPGSQISNAFWTLSANTLVGSCCSLVSVTGITGVTLTGGQEYFMVLRPVAVGDNSFNDWMMNSQGATGHVLGSGDGGAHWNDPGAGPLAAFDVLTGPAAPEPGSFVLLGSALIGVAFYRRRSRA